MKRTFELDLAFIPYNSQVKIDRGSAIPDVWPKPLLAAVTPEAADYQYWLPRHAPWHGRWKQYRATCGNKKAMPSGAMIRDVATVHSEKSKEMERTA